MSTTIDNPEFYKIVKAAVETERLLYQAHQLLGNEREAHECYRKILQWEKNLSLIRSSRLPRKGVH